MVSGNTSRVESTVVFTFPLVPILISREKDDNLFYAQNIIV